MPTEKTQKEGHRVAAAVARTAQIAAQWRGMARRVKERAQKQKEKVGGTLIFDAPFDYEGVSLEYM